MKTIGYLRVSTNKQDLDNQKQALKAYCHDHKIHIDEFIEIHISSRKSTKERRIEELLSKLIKGDRIIVTELSRLGRSISQIIRLIDTLIKSEIQLITIKENIKINGNMDMQTKCLVTIISLFGEIERDLISKRITEALAVRRDKGVVLGRKVGSLSSKLDKDKDEILELLKLGVTQKKLAKKYDISPVGFSLWMKRRNIVIE